MQSAEIDLQAQQRSGDSVIHSPRLEDQVRSRQPAAGNAERGADAAVVAVDVPPDLETIRREEVQE